MTIQGLTTQLTWTGTNPAPYRVITNQPVGTPTGTMSGTATIYTEILDVAARTRVDNMGLELTWTGTPTGTIQVMGSNSGVNFYALTFNPVLGQPAGSASGYLIDLTQYPFHYLMIEYTNASGSGTLSAYLTGRSL